MAKCNALCFVLFHLFVRVLLEVLQHNVQSRHIVVRPVSVLDGDVCEHLREGLQELCEGEVVLVGNRLHVIVCENC